MNIYLISQDKNRGYDCYWNHVVRAESPEEVVELVQLKPADEGADAWRVENVILLGKSVPAESSIVVSDFNAG